MNRRPRGPKPRIITMLDYAPRKTRPATRSRYKLTDSVKKISSLLREQASEFLFR